MTSVALGPGLVREARRERGLLLQRLAPHLVRPVRFLYPLRNRVWERAYVSAGVTLYDAMGGARSLPRHRQLTRRAALREAPALRSDALVGAVQYYDAQVDDARYTMMVARTAARYGARVATRAEATGFLREGERVTGVHVLDLEGNREIAVRARRVVCATGVWTDGAQAMTGARAAFGVRASKGVHLVVPRDRIPNEVLWNERRRLAAESGLHIARIEHLLHRYGSCAREVLAMVANDPALGAAIPCAEDYLCAEAVYAVTHEGALHLEDVLSRRLRVSIEEWDGGVAAASRVAELVAPWLGWDDERVSGEVKRYVLQVAAERRGGPAVEKAPVTAA